MPSERSTEAFLKGQTALVVGGASGIGAACSLHLANAGARIVVADQNLMLARRVAEELGGGAVAVECDVTQARGPEDAVSTAVGLGEGLQIAVNCAGIAGGTPMLVGEYDFETWQRIIDVNLNGTFHCLRAELAAMHELRDGASIVNIASILGAVGVSGSAAYTASKHAVVGLTKTAALDYARWDIRVNAVGPGYIDTPMIAHVTSEARDQLISRHPLGRLGQAKEVAELVTFLASPRASFITGSFYAIDGGYTAQ